MRDEREPGLPPTGVSRITDQAPSAIKIGVISDTHDFLDPKISGLFAEVDHIFHAGDVGTAWIIFQLEQIAPVTAVLGNNDSTLTLKETEIVQLASRKFLVHHIVNPYAPGEQLARRIARQRPDVVVFGHTHKPFNESLGGILYLNPGYAGSPKSGSERSVVILHCHEKMVRVDFLPL